MRLHQVYSPVKRCLLWAFVWVKRPQKAALTTPDSATRLTRPMLSAMTAAGALAVDKGGRGGSLASRGGRWMRWIQRWRLFNKRDPQ